MEDKPKHEASGMDPFTYAKAEKRQKTEKQNLAQLKNKVHGSAETQKKDVKILAASKGEGLGNKSMKLREDADRDKLRKREHKSLAKSLKMAQMSTASMGRFDKKAGKNEPDAPISQKIKKKKSNAALDHLANNTGDEKARNMKIFDTL